MQITHQDFWKENKNDCRRWIFCSTYMYYYYTILKITVEDGYFAVYTTITILNFVKCVQNRIFEKISKYSLLKNTIEKIILNKNTGVYISVQKRYLSPPPFWKRYFFPLLRHVVFWLPSWPFCLNSSLFAFILPFYFPFSHFLSPFFLFLLHFLPFSLRLFIFFPQMTLAEIPPSEGRVFSNI